MGIGCTSVGLPINNPTSQIADPWWQVQVGLLGRPCQIIALHNCLDYAQQWRANSTSGWGWCMCSINLGSFKSYAIRDGEAPSVLLAILSLVKSRLRRSKHSTRRMRNVSTTHINIELNTCQCESLLINYPLQLSTLRCEWKAAGAAGTGFLLRRIR